jgi:hypothetical protein
LILHRHRHDEFPAGYSSASCSPAELASASPANNILLDGKLRVVQHYSEGGTAFIPRVSPKGFTPFIRVHLRLSAARMLFGVAHLRTHLEGADSFGGAFSLRACLMMLA